MSQIKITLFHTKQVAGQAADVWSRQIDAGNAFLKRYNLVYDRYPLTGSIELDYGTTLAKEGRSDPGKKQRDEIRTLANTAYYSAQGRLPVILCSIAGGGGESPGSLGFHSDWLPYVIIDPGKLNPDGLTLTHEAGHCAGLLHTWDEPRLGSQDTDNFMSYGQFDIGTQSRTPRTLIMDWQVDALRASYFIF